jgi:hypothetical protein
MSDSDAGSEKTRKYGNQVTSGGCGPHRGIVLRRNKCLRRLGLALIVRTAILPITGAFSMIRDRNERKWLLIAAIAIVVALVLLLIPQAHSGHVSVWLAILPIQFIGLIWLLCLLPASGNFHLAHAKGAPALQPSFQRPPPLTIA